MLNVSPPTETKSVPQGGSAPLDFGLIFDALPGAYLVVARDGSILAVTEGLRRATHTTSKEVVGRSIFDVFPKNPDEGGSESVVATLRASLERVGSTGRPDAMAVKKYDIPRRGPEGGFEARYWSVLNSPAPGPDGTPTYVVMRVEDVTEFVHTKQREPTLLRGTAGGARGAAHDPNTPDGSAASPVEAEIFLRAQQIDEANRQLRELQEALEARVAERTAALSDANEKLRRSEEHLRQVELRSAQDTLAEERHVFNRFFTLSIDFLCIAGVDGYFRRINPAFSALGYPTDELLSQPFLAFVHPDDQAATMAEVEKLARGAITVRFENRYRCKDGSYRWLSWSTTPDPSGTLYAVAHDITDKKRVEEELRAAKLAAEAANRELEAFSYSVAHDLRSPLRGIDGFSQALLEDYAGKLDDQGRDYLQRLRLAAQRMAQLIDDLLTLSRVSRGDLTRTQVDLGAMARTIVGRLQERDPTRHVELVVSGDLTADGDARLLAAALENLLGNAWKFSSHNAETHMEVGSLLQDGERVYFVRDHGAGFDMAYAHKLFGAFQRLHTVQEFEGTGIGLATVRRIVERHGGRIWPEAEVGQGACFYFTLGQVEARDPAGDQYRSRP